MAKNQRKVHRNILSTRATISVPEAGDLLGIGRNQAYEAAKTGEIPTIKIGGRIIVPTAALQRKLENA